MSIYRAYDIRGVYGTELTDDLGEKIGKAIEDGQILPSQVEKWPEEMGVPIQDFLAQWKDLVENGPEPTDDDDEIGTGDF